MKVIEKRLNQLNYIHWKKVLSPHDFGTCQIRKRAYIVCIRKDLQKSTSFNFLPNPNQCWTYDSVLDDKVDKKYNMSKEELSWLEMWEEFLKNVNKDTKLPASDLGRLFSRTRKITRGFDVIFYLRIVGYWQAFGKVIVG